LSVLIAWVPLILFAVLQSIMAREDEISPMLREVGVHARYLVAVPLLVLAEAACAPQLSAIVRHFADSGVVCEGDRRRFQDAIASTRRLLLSSTAEIVVVVLAYLVVGATMLSHPADELPAWAKPVSITPHFSLAAWWHLLVSLPLLLILIFGWFWRLALWARLLWLIARLDLRLVALHPDHCAGLGFLGHSARAFAIVALALAAVAAGRSAHVVLAGGTLQTPYLYFNIGLALAIMALFVAPLLVFTPTLLTVGRRARTEYGALAERVGQVFERKWLDPPKVEQTALDRPDFSTTTDLYSVVSNVYSMRFLPVDYKDLVVLAVAMLIPFLPVALLAFPVDVILKHAKSLLF
jgi:hypothetical protein